MNSAQAAIDAYTKAKAKLQSASQAASKKAGLKLQKSMHVLHNTRAVQTLAKTEAYQRVVGQNLSAVDILKRLPKEAARQVLRGLSFAANLIFSKAFAFQMAGSVICNGPTVYLINEIRGPKTQL